MWTLTVPTIWLDAHASASRDQIPLRVSIPSYLSTQFAWSYRTTPYKLFYPHSNTHYVLLYITFKCNYIYKYDFNKLILLIKKYKSRKDNQVTYILSSIFFFYQIHTIFLEIKIFQNLFSIYFYMKKKFFFFSYSIHKISIKMQTIYMITRSIFVKVKDRFQIYKK